MAGGFINGFRNRCCGSTALMVLLAVNMLIGLLLIIAGLVPTRGGGAGRVLSEWLSLGASPMDLIYRPWTLVTYMFTQVTLIHLLVNLLWLYWFGQILLTIYGDRALAWIYLGGGIAGGVVYILASFLGLVYPGSQLCGASASLLAMMTVAAVKMPDMRLNLMLIGSVRLKWIAIFTILITLFGGSGGLGSILAHGGGVLFGVLYGTGWLRGFGTGRKGFAGFGSKNSKSGQRKFSRRQINNVISAVQGESLSHERLDELLDKIRISGYSSLTPGEKLELQAISHRLEKEGDKQN